MDRTDSARQVNVGCMPSSGAGALSVEVWAIVFDVSEQSILEWIGRHKILFKQFGRTRMISPGDMWSCVPYANVVPPEPEPEPIPPAAPAPKPKRKKR